MKKSLLKFLGVMLSVFLVLSVAACGGSQEAANGEENSSSNSNASAGENGGESSGEQVAKIGVISYLSGNGAAYGEAITSGFKMAQEEINEKYKGQLKIELLIEDSAGQRDQALNAAQKLINSENVLAILGPTLSSEMFVVGPEADQAGVPIMGTSTTANGIPEIGPYVFRNSIPESLAIPASMKRAVEHFGIKKVALIYGHDDDFTLSGYEIMKDTAEKLGLEIVKTEKYATGDTDFSAQLTNIQAAQPDAILASALYKEGGLILDQARKMGIDVPVVGGNGFNSPQVIVQAGEAAEGVVVASPWFPERDVEEVQTFVNKFQEKYGKIPDQFAAQAYDALYILTKAILDAGTTEDRDALRDSLAQIKDFKGVTGNFSFDEVGSPIMDPVVLIIKDGKFVEFVD